ncbi:MAG TPA: calcium-binding protein [Allosphingosinicella sp.]
MPIGTDGNDKLHNDLSVQPDTVDARGGDDRIVITQPPQGGNGYFSVDVIGGSGFDILEINDARLMSDVHTNTIELAIGWSGRLSIAHTGIERIVLSGSGEISTGDTEDWLTITFPHRHLLRISSGGGDDRIVVLADPRLDDVKQSLVEAGAGNDFIDLRQASTEVHDGYYHIVRGGDGNDRIIGSISHDVLIGGLGDDVLDGHHGANDRLAGGMGDDVYLVRGAETVEEALDQGIDEVRTDLSTYILPAEVEKLTHTGIGTGGATLRGNVIDNVVRGSNGDDLFLLQDGGRDTVLGGAGDDSFYFGAAYEGEEGFRDAIDGGAGSDTIFVQNDARNTETDLSRDIVGIERIVLLSSTDNRFGGATDKNSYHSLKDWAGGVAAGATLTIDCRGLLSGEVVGVSCRRTAANLIVYGGPERDTITTGSGNDVIDGGGGDDRLHGSSGNDIYRIDHAGDFIEEFSGDGQDRVVASVSYDLTRDAHVEVVGTANAAATTAIDLGGNDLRNSIYGNAGRNVLRGDGGGDYLVGLGGDDSLVGGGGSDVLRGGAGSDEFRFDTNLSRENIDRIADFSVADDTISLDDAVFRALGAGPLSAGAFATGAAAADAGDRIIYNSATGALIYDADGTGAAAAIRFATLDPALSLTASDFVVI